jgi:hypothetical protein
MAGGLAALVAAGLATTLYLARDQSTARDPLDSPNSISRTTEPKKPPSLLPASDGNEQSWLLVRVETLTGNPIEDARIFFDERTIGTTGREGTARIDTRTHGLPVTGRLVARTNHHVAAKANYVAPGEVRFRLTPGSVIAGTAVVSTTGSPVPGVTVFARDVQTVTDAEGRFTFANLPGDVYRLSARGAGWFGESDDLVYVGPGSVRTDVLVSVSRAYAIRGTVLVNGRPFGSGGARVRGAADGSEVSAEGRYEIQGVPPGKYKLSLEFRGECGWSPEVDIDVVNTDKEVDIDAGPRASLIIQARDPQGHRSCPV